MAPLASLNDYARARWNVPGGFAADEAGAVTVDWIVLSAALIALAIGTIAMVRNSTSGVSGQLENSLTVAEVGDLNLY